MSPLAARCCNLSTLGVWVETLTQPANKIRQQKQPSSQNLCLMFMLYSGLTKKAEPPPTRDVNRDSGTASANGGWLRRLVRRHIVHISKSCAKNPCFPFGAKSLHQ